MPAIGDFLDHQRTPGIDHHRGCRLAEGWRTALVGVLVDRLAIDSDVAPFLFTRAATSLVFLVLAGHDGPARLGHIGESTSAVVTRRTTDAARASRQPRRNAMVSSNSGACRAARCSTGEDFLQYAFLTIAWFWLLPTGNPWYWTWAMPLLPFARSRAWLALCGLVMLYNLRFWFVYHFPVAGVLGTPYAGAPFFDYVVTWLEFAPFLGALIVAGWRKNRSLAPFG